MSVPTGMSNNTVLHWNHVAAQLNNYFNQNNGRQMYAAHGNMHQFQPSHGIAHAPRFVGNNGYQRMPVRPAMNNNVDDIARNRVRHLLRP
ncbi:hypothetical protein I4U23_003830 [Adineta vaga]|nr:hypothetical protein I4U23_003830 [Adineta vaga]